MKIILATLLAATLAVAARAEDLSGLCMLSASHNASTADFLIRSGDCGDENHNCNMSSHSDMAWSRFTGVSAGELKREGAQLTAHMAGEPGDLQCSGAVHDGVLAGKYTFTPSHAFPQTMAAMGFDEISPRKQESFLMLDITTAWVREIKSLGVTDINTGKLISLKALHVDPAYIRSMSEAGYPEMRAGKLIEMKAVGVTPEKAREARALGFQPTEQELVQMSIFKIDRSFVERMRAKGLTDLTLAKLIKVKIFKLDD